MKRQVLTAMAGWLILEMAAFALVIAALGVSGAGLFGAADRPMSEAEAARELATLPPVTARASPPAENPPAPPGKLVSTALGSARLTCAGDTPNIEYVSPDPGFSYSFKKVTGVLYILIAGEGKTVQIETRCPAGGPQVAIS